MNMEQLKRLVEIDQNTKALKSEIEALETERDGLEEALLEQFVEDGVQSVKANGTTVFIRRQIFAGVDTADGETVDDAHERARLALESAGLSEFVHTRVNAQQLSAWVRELQEREEPLPDELSNVIRINEKFQLRSKRAA